jgi:hypothetical protein
MKMMSRIIDPLLFNQETWRIRTKVSTVLKKWGLLPRFKRWRLTQDPGTGMVVLFGVLNKKYIATHTSTPFIDYFAPHLLHDLKNELQVQVVSCNSDDLRYAFILDRDSQLEKLPTHIDFPFLDGDRLFVRLVYGVKAASELLEPQIRSTTLIADEQTLIHRGVDAFLKVFKDIKILDHMTPTLSTVDLSSILIIEENKSEKRGPEQEAN